MGDYKLKRKVLSEEDLQDIILPGAGQVLGIAVKMLGLDRISLPLGIRSEEGGHSVAVHEKPERLA